MKKFRFILRWIIQLVSAGLFLLSIVFLLFLYNPSIFITDIESTIEKFIKIDKYPDLDVKLQGIDGNFFDGFNIQNISAYNNSVPLIDIDNILIFPNIKSLIFAKIQIDSIKFENGFVDLPYDLTLIKELKGNKLLLSELSINYIPKIVLSNIEFSNLNLNYAENNYNMRSKISINIDKSIQLQIHELIIENIQNKNKLSINKGSIIYTLNQIYMNFNDFAFNDNIKGKIFTDIDLIHSNLFSEVEIDYININSSIFNEISSRSAKIQINSDDLIIYNYKLDSEVIIDNDYFSIYSEGNYKDNKLVILENSKLSSPTKSLLFKGIYNNNSQLLDIEFEIENFNFRNFSKLHGTSICSVSNENYDCNIDLSKAIISENSFNSITGNLIKSKEGINFTGFEFTTKLGNRFIVNNSNFKDYNNFSINGELFISDINELKSTNLESYYMNGKGNVLFSIISINNIRNSQIKYSFHEVEFQKSKFNTLYGNINEINNLIQAEIHADDFVFENIFFDSLDASIYSDTTDKIIVKINGVNKKTGDFIDIDSKLVTFSELVINQLNGRVHDVGYEINNLKMNKLDNVVIVHPNTLTIGDGELKISAKIKNKDWYSVQLESENININSINKLFFDQQRLIGILNGDIYVSNTPDNLIILSNIEVYDGKFDDIIFNKLFLQGSLRDNRISISNFDLRTDLGHVNVNGSLISQYNQSFSLISSDTLNINGDFDDFDISFLNRYFPWSYDTKGELSGDFSITGTAGSPKIIITPTILYPEFDKIKGDIISGKLVYNDHRLYLSGIQLLTDYGNYSGTGFIPMNLDLADNEHKLDFENNIDLIFTGNSSAFEFLTPYIDNINKINGEFAMQLNITGSIQDPVRDGQISLQNGIIDLLKIDNNISDVSGIVKISNNRLMIDHLSGELIKKDDDHGIISDLINKTINIFTSEEKKLKSGIIEASGSIDLTDFFNPDYSIYLNGDDIYLTSNHMQIEGFGNSHIYVTGKDTVLISGEFKPLPNQFTVYDIVNNDSYQIDKINKGKFYEYDIHIPIHDGIRLLTDNLNLYLDGDITISSFDDDGFKFSGKANIIDGKFKFNGNEFITNDGIIILDPSSNYPYVEVYAETHIFDDNIDISFIGYLDNPTLLLESSTSDYSQSDIFQLLTFKVNYDKGSQGNQIGDFLSNYLESQIENNITLYTELDEFNVEHSGSIIDGIENSDINLYLGKRITSNLYVNTRINLKESLSNEYEVAYRLNNNISIVAKMDKNSYWHLKYQYKYRY